MEFKPRTICLDCSASLPEGRVLRCEMCEEAFAVRLEQFQQSLRSSEIDERLRESGLPDVYVRGARTPADLPLDNLYAEACRGLGRVHDGLMLCGPPKSGKTSAACCYLTNRIRHGGSGLFVNSASLQTSVHAAYANAPGAYSRQELVRMYGRAPVLVLDDLGHEKASEHSANVLYEILNERFNRKGKGILVITSNYRFDQILRRFEAPPEIVHAIGHRLSFLTTIVSGWSK